MSGGTKHDGGKLPWHLIPFDAIEQVVRVLDFGARKYTQKVEHWLPDVLQNVTQIDRATCDPASVEAAMKNAFGEKTQRSLSDSGRIQENGRHLTQKKSSALPNVERQIPACGNGTRLPADAPCWLNADWRQTGLIALASSSADCAVFVQDALAKCAPCIWIMTMKPGWPGGYCVVAATTDSDSLKRVLSFWRERLNISPNLPQYGADLSVSGSRNWEKGIAYSRVFAAAQRHLTSWWQGEDRDPETGLSHMAHASCCALFLLAFVARKRSDLDDRPGVDRSRESSPPGYLGRVEASPLGPVEAPPRADKLSDAVQRSIGGVFPPGKHDIHFG